MKGNNKGIYVILPIYKDVDMTRACIKSAMPGILGIPNTSLIAINDGSPDAGMDEMLSEMSSEYGATISVLKNEKNLGFVQTVNRGFGQSVGKDVVLLNSDVVVSGDWLRRLRDVCYSESNIGTVTPFSNNATICSFPAFLEEQELPQGWTQSEIDRIFSLRDLPPVDAPTGVGFCMFIKAKCLESVGILNYEKFGRGYGEENDFCQRAIKLGWRNVITSNVFGYHKGGVSFSTEKNALVERAMKTLDELHPNYHRDVQLFIKADTMKAQRIQRSIDLLQFSNKPVCLAVTHELGGGVRQHVLELAQYLVDQTHTIVLSPKEDSMKVTLSLFPLERGDEFDLWAERDYAEIINILRNVNTSFVHFHHTHGLNPKIWSIPFDLRVKYALTAHDFYWINANPTLTNEQGMYLAEAKNINNPLYPLPPGVSEEKWRESLSPLVDGAEFLIFPSNSTKEIFSSFYKNSNRVAVYHPDQGREAAVNYPPIFKKDITKILSIGALGREKGADLLEAIAKRIDDHLCEVVLLGYAYRPLSNVRVMGSYRLEETRENIIVEDPDIFLFTALWPETFSYTLSYALAHGAPIIAPDVGAFPERLSGRKNVLLFDHKSDPNDISSQILAFIEDMKRGVQTFSRVCATAEQPQAFYKNRYVKSFGVRENVNIMLGPPIILTEDSISRPNIDKTSKEKLLLVLWGIYQSKFGGLIAPIIPFRFRRAVKRFLSRRSIADLRNNQ